MYKYKYLILLFLASSFSSYSSDQHLESNAIKSHQQDTWEPRKKARLFNNGAHIIPLGNSFSIENFLDTKKSRLSLQPYPKLNNEVEVSPLKSLNEQYQLGPAKPATLHLNIPPIDCQQQSPGFLSHILFEDMPDELLLAIFMHLHIKDIVNLRIVSKRWQVLLDDQTLWKNQACYLMSSYFLVFNKSLIDCQQLVQKIFVIPLSFVDLGTLNDGKNCKAHAMSFDGHLIVGRSEDSMQDYADRAFYWTPSQGMCALKNNKEILWSEAFSVDANAQTIIGVEGKDWPENTTNAIEWLINESIQKRRICHENFATKAKDISAKGKIIVGCAKVKSSNKACIWTAEQGLRFIDHSDLGISKARAVSADGKVIVGFSTDGTTDNIPKAFIWTAEQGIKFIDHSNLGISKARAVSADGKVVVGCAKVKIGSNNKAFIWTAEQGMQFIDHSNLSMSKARAVSANGKIVVGYSTNGNTEDIPKAFIWTKDKGQQFIQKILADVIPFGWQLTEIVDISWDGTTIVGNGIYKNFDRAWQATIPHGNLFKKELN